ncbi:hypothetical protein SAMN05421810_10252 [Amycolatopsis arida]|uniref:Uncharacterized protein n=1 Tax=Amycolatopsis arida TaxID=587909 RepID=A0A1I5NVZ6_9PSEU|nr:hypothetical protein [Amycolatopsis arida]TDX98263.1 hypothetical protein CLV69_10152 [Amycolatopsis arida]SFP25965.1 hypothetical protein SAMN05421810_10252 [Amycolatopsis arida]
MVVGENVVPVHGYGHLTTTADSTDDPSDGRALLDQLIAYRDAF